MSCLRGVVLSTIQSCPVLKHELVDPALVIADYPLLPYMAPSPWQLLQNKHQNVYSTNGSRLFIVLTSLRALVT